MYHLTCLLRLAYLEGKNVLYCYISRVAIIRETMQCFIKVVISLEEIKAVLYNFLVA
jgi:hypothetical protein